MTTTPPADRPTEQQGRDFRKELRRLRPYEIAEKRYDGDWGKYDARDSSMSSWRVREANRRLTTLNRRSELWPLTFGVWVAVITAAVAIMALPLSDSVLTEFAGRDAAKYMMATLAALLAGGSVVFLWLTKPWQHD